MQLNVKFNSKFSSRLSAMQHSVESSHIRDISAKSKPNSKIF
jgi:hypothetical protein